MRACVCVFKRYTVMYINLCQAMMSPYIDLVLYFLYPDAFTSGALLTLDRQSHPGLASS